MELTQPQKQYIVNAVDLYVKTHGVQVAGMGLQIIQILQKPTPEPDDNTNDKK